MPTPEPAPPVLAYSPTRRRRRWPAILVALAVLLSLAVATFYTYPRLALWHARREGFRQVQAWYQQARTFRLPPTTLMYSENPADFPAGRTTAGGDSGSGAYAVFTTPYPALRVVAYRAGGVPILEDYGVIFAHERLSWDTGSSTGSSPQLVAVRYEGLDPATGGPLFNVFTYRPITVPAVYFHAGITGLRGVPSRPLANLRLYAGQPDPQDRAKFFIPFQCDSGTGRFLFQMDIDVSDGGALTPTLEIQWDAQP